MSIVFVTGANRGIGLELCRQLSNRGDTVIAACRKSSPELEALGVRVEVGVDVGSDEAIKALGRRMEGQRIDVLINNAGILERHGLDSFVLASIRRQFEINALGPLRVTAALLPNVHRGGKVIVVTSRMGSIGDNTSGGHYGYRMSKAAVNMAAVSLSHDLRSRDIALLLLHPGFVKTELTGGNGNVTPAEAAAQMIQRIDALDMKSSGSFLHANGEPLPW